MPYTWLADASSVAFLDLGVFEYRIKRNTTLISALDLRVRPRNYYRRPYRECIAAFKNGQNGIPSGNNLPAMPRVPVIEVFILRQTIPEILFDDFEDPSFMDAVGFFYDTSRYILKSLATTGKPEFVKLYLWHLRAYCDYIETSIFRTPLNASRLEPEVVFTFYSDGNLGLVRKLLDKILSNVTDLLFEHKFPDPSLVWELFYKVHFILYDKQIHLNIIFNCKPETAEYMLHHLRKKCHMKDYWMIYSNNRELESYFQCFFRSKPEHLLLQFKYGVAVEYEPIFKACDLFLKQIIEDRVWPIRNAIKDIWSSLNPRERRIAEMILCYLFWPPEMFETYLESLRIMWRSIPEHYLSEDELKSMLLIHEDLQDEEELHHVFRKYKIDFFTEFPQPRRLSHYSRCVIRDVLFHKSQLPEGIALLNLPPHLQSYISLEF